MSAENRSVEDGECQFANFNWEVSSSCSNFETCPERMIIFTLKRKKKHLEMKLFLLFF